MKNIIGFILIIAIVFGLYAFYAKQEAKKEREREEAQRIKIYQEEEAAKTAAEARTLTRQMIVAHNVSYTPNMEKIYSGTIKNIFSKTITNIVFGFSDRFSSNNLPELYYQGYMYNTKHNLLITIYPNNSKAFEFSLISVLNQYERGLKATIVSVRFSDGSIETGDGYKFIDFD